MEQQLTTGSILSLIDTDRATREAFVRSHIQLLKEGNGDPLLSHVQAKNMEQMLKDMFANDEYKKLVLEEAAKYGSKSFERHNAKVEIKEVGTKYDYSVCNDSTYNAMVQEQEALAKKIKAREKMLQTLPASGMADPDSGEMIYPAAKSSTTTVSITLN